MNKVIDNRTATQKRTFDCMNTMYIYESGDYQLLYSQLTMSESVYVKVHKSYTVKYFRISTK